MHAQISLVRKTASRGCGGNDAYPEVVCDGLDETGVWIWECNEYVV